MLPDYAVSRPHTRVERDRIRQKSTRRVLGPPPQRHRLIAIRHCPCCNVERGCARNCEEVSTIAMVNVDEKLVLLYQLLSKRGKSRESARRFESVVELFLLEEESLSCLGSH